MGLGINNKSRTVLYDLLFVFIFICLQTKIVAQDDRFTGTKLTKTNLIYYVDNGTTDISEDGELSALEAALGIWEANTPFKFTSTQTESQADIKIYYVSYARLVELEGAISSETRAFTYADGNHPRYGELYVNDDITFQWTSTMESNSYDLQWVFTHEIGHYLGLADIRDGDRAYLMMYAYINSPQRNLHADDIIAINELYDWVILENRFSGGTVKVNGITKDAPYGIILETGDSKLLEAVDQESGGISYVWNTTGNSESISTWGYKREDSDLLIPLQSATSRQYSLNYSDGYDRYAFRPGLKKELEVDFTSDGDLTVTYNGTTNQYSQTTPKLTVVEEKDIRVEILATFGVDYINYYFDHWANDGSTVNPRTFNPTEDVTYEAISKGYARTDVMNIHFVGSAGDFISLDWDDHPNTSVTQYQVWRIDPSHSTGILLATKNRGNTDYTDHDYSYYQAPGTALNLKYAVIAKYVTQSDSSWSTKNWRTILGEEDRNIQSTDEPVAEAAVVAEIEKTELSYSIGNSPNPFNPTTQISYMLPEAEQVTIKVFNMLGKEVATLVNEVKSKGQHNVIFDASNLSSGIYIYAIQTPHFSESGKMILMK